MERLRLRRLIRAGSNRKHFEGWILPSLRAFLHGERQVVARARSGDRPHRAGEGPVLVVAAIRIGDGERYRHSIERRAGSEGHVIACPGDVTTTPGNSGLALRVIGVDVADEGACTTRRHVRACPEGNGCRGCGGTVRGQEAAGRRDEVFCIRIYVVCDRLKVSVRTRDGRIGIGAGVSVCSTNGCALYLISATCG